MSREIIFESQTLSGFALNSELGFYTYEINPAPFSVTADQVYTVSWDETDHICYSFESNGSIVLGNSLPFGLCDTHEPFTIQYTPSDAGGSIALYSTQEAESHDVCVYTGVADDVEGIVLYNIDGLKRIHHGIDTLTVDTTTPDKVQTFTKGVVADPGEINIELNFQNGDHEYEAPDGILIKTATIKKPKHLTSENIAKDITIAGIIGTHESVPETESVIVDLYMADGDMVITPSEGKLLSKVTVDKPYNFSAENIKSGTKIGGITGSYVTPNDDITVELDMANGNQVVTPTSNGRLINSVTVERPAALIPANIAEGVNIAGVIGTHTGGGTDGLYTVTQIATGTITGEVDDDTVVTIVGHAFANNQITAASFPVCASIGEFAFADCSMLSSITLDYSNLLSVPTAAFRNTLISGNINVPSCSMIGSEAFKGCSNIITLDAPLCKGDAGLGSYAFMGCTSLKSIAFSTACSIINKGMFSGCSNLETIGDDAKITKVADYAFCGCSKLQRISFNNAFVSVGTYAFRSCTSLSQVDGTLDFTHMLGAYAFSNCTALKSITIGFTYDDAERHISSAPFWGCTALSRVTMASDTTIPPIPVDWFGGTPISSSSYLGYFGSIYVPSSKYYSFRSASGWSNYSARMVSYT